MAKWSSIHWMRQTILSRAQIQHSSQRNSCHITPFGMNELCVWPLMVIGCACFNVYILKRLSCGNYTNTKRVRNAPYGITTYRTYFCAHHSTLLPIDTPSSIAALSIRNYCDLRASNSLLLHSYCSWHWHAKQNKTMTKEKAFTGTLNLHLQTVPIVENTMSIRPIGVCAKLRSRLYGQSHPFRSRPGSLGSGTFSMQLVPLSPMDDCNEWKNDCNEYLI